MKRARAPRSKTTELGERIRTYAAQYLSSDQKERAEGLAQAADLVDEYFSRAVTTLMAPGSDFAERLARLEHAVFENGTAVAKAKPKPVQPEPAVVHARTAAKAFRHLTFKDGLSRCERAILHSCMQMEGAATLSQIGVLSGYSPTSGSFGTALGALRAAGYLEGSRDHLVITDDGRTAAGPCEVPPRGAGFLPWWQARIGHQAYVLLEIIARAHPKTLMASELSTATGYSPTSGSFGTAVGRLRSMGLVARGVYRDREPLFGLTPWFVQRWRDE